jgi:hypothetical protein
MDGNLFNIFFHSHEGSWLFVVIAFLLSAVFQGQKVTPILLRIFYLIMLVTGVGMLGMLGFPAVFIIKGILAIILIGIMEMILGRQRRKKPTLALWILFVILLVVVVLMGFQVISF